MMTLSIIYLFIGKYNTNAKSLNKNKELDLY